MWQVAQEMIVELETPSYLGKIAPLSFLAL